MYRNFQEIRRREEKNTSTSTVGTQAPTEKKDTEHCVVCLEPGSEQDIHVGTQAPTL